MPSIAVMSIDGRILAPFSIIKTIALAFKRCPAPTPVFTGCDKQVQRIERFITGSANERQVVVICGLGGGRKTQIALKVVENSRDKWAHVLYVGANSHEGIENTPSMFAWSNRIGGGHIKTP
ncbi:hypothetical protein B0J17DRAFT_121777 [Rhizoctonia solani]|nr:hypothetical protein B0J17DRAFT_121777 [Rhizoctonia solani]